MRHEQKELKTFGWGLEYGYVFSTLTKKALCQYLSRPTKRLVAVLATSTLVIKASMEDSLQPLKKIPYIHHPLRFQKDPHKDKALIDLSNEVNTMTPVYAAKLGLKVWKTNIGAQKIDGYIFDTFGIHWEILCKPDPNGGSEIPSIYRDPLLAALDPTFGAFHPPLSTFSGLSPALILFRAELWIDDSVQSRTLDWWSCSEPDCGPMSILGLIWSLIEHSIRSQVTQVLFFCYFNLLLNLLMDPQVN